MIPIARPVFGEEEIEAVASVIRSGMIASGEIVTRFEEEFSTQMSVKHAIATNNGTSALHVSLLAAGVNPGDEVIVPSFTFIATASSVSICGAKPVVADVEYDTACIDPVSVSEQITSKTRAVIGVHLFGHPFNINAIQEICLDNNLILIEDCAQAHGAEYRGKKVGVFGDAGCFSFYPTKNMTTGEGGMVISDDKKISERIRRLINHGQQEKYLHTETGYNYRMTNLAAAMGRVQLQKLSTMNTARQKNAGYYNLNIKRRGILCPVIRELCSHVYHQYAIRVTPDCGINRDEFARKLGEDGVMTAVHYPVPIHRQPVYKGIIKGSSCTVSEKLSREILSLPVYPSLTAEEREIVCNSVNRCD